MKKLYFLREYNTTIGIGGDVAEEDEDGRFRAVGVKSSIFIDNNPDEIKSRLRKLLLTHRKDHSSLNNARNPIREGYDYITEDMKLTKKDLDTVERYADNLFHTLGVDITFTNHFLDRANDSRNGKQITVQELITLFNRQYTVNGVKIRRMQSDTEAVLKDLQSDINSPVYFEWDKKTKMLEMRLKTTMRKKNFTSPDPILKA